MDLISAYVGNIYLLWEHDSNFKPIIIGFAGAIILLFVMLFVFRVNWLSIVFPGGRIAGNSRSTAFPRKIPIFTLIIGAMLYIGFKVNNTIFIEDRIHGFICEYKPDFLHNLVTAGRVRIDMWFFILIFMLATVIIPLFYIIWFDS